MNCSCKDYEKEAEIFKALSDQHRMCILEQLTEGELCACKLLEKLEISQPTLSHHMKILTTAGFVSARRSGKWMYYSISKDGFDEASFILQELTRSFVKKGD